jgi:hypothetical protein
MGLLFRYEALTNIVIFWVLNEDVISTVAYEEYGEF